MIERILAFSIRQRWLVVIVTLAAGAFGAWNFTRLPIDAVPDVTNMQVQINTRAPGLSPLESEQRITFPIETAMGGLPRLDYTRSISRYGLSQVTVVFQDGTDSTSPDSWSTNASSRCATSCHPASKSRWGRSRRGSAKSTPTPSRQNPAPRRPAAASLHRPICAPFRTGSSSRNFAPFLA
jgi:hypothetical protein